MKTDVNGCSTCQTGTEHYEEVPEFFYRDRLKTKKFFQYDYRHTDGKLFSTVAPSLGECRQRRDEWLAKRYKKFIVVWENRTRNLYDGLDICDALIRAGLGHITVGRIANLEMIDCQDYPGELEDFLKASGGTNEIECSL